MIILHDACKHTAFVCMMHTLRWQLIFRVRWIRRACFEMNLREHNAHLAAAATDADADADDAAKALLRFPLYAGAPQPPNPSVTT